MCELVQRDLYLLTVTALQCDDSICAKAAQLCGNVVSWSVNKMTRPCRGILGDTNTQGCLAQSVTVENSLQYDSATIPVV